MDPGGGRGAMSKHLKKTESELFPWHTKSSVGVRGDHGIPTGEGWVGVTNHLRDTGKLSLSKVGVGQAENRTVFQSECT